MSGIFFPTLRSSPYLFFRLSLIYAEGMNFLVQLDIKDMAAIAPGHATV